MFKALHLFWGLLLGGVLIVYLFTNWGQDAVLTEQQRNIYSLITPFAIIMLLMEMAYSAIAGRKLFSFQESIANFGTALGNQTSNLLVAALVYVTYDWLWSNFHWLDLPIDAAHWYNALLLLVGIDFIFYWFHRWGHQVNILWAAHSPHHSAEEMNLMVGLRASVTQRLMSFLFFWPLTLLGFHPFDLYMMVGLHLFLSYWHHTEVIPKLGRWFEFFFNSPSHHRVHHGVNFQYLDKNFSEMLIIWDRIFGTFEEEDEKVVYGMYNGPKSWNPIRINLHYYIQIWNLAKAAPYWWDKIKVWFMPLTWRPRGLPPYEPNAEITVDNQVRYRTTMFAHAKGYLVLHMVLCLFLMVFIITPSLGWTTFERWIGAAVLWHTIINLSGILEARPWLYVSEQMRLFFLGLIWILFNDWHIQPVYLITVAVLLGSSMWWTHRHFHPDRSVPEPPSMEWNGAVG